ncbi:hypothetical protein FH972_021382 [Carpinus fangiana]|uniref:methionine--tRNA ligase n=1 Tax=Carpinus fangiana TaxID=176857 RepID=A0A5N6KP72_9ROSI|nr:hypothetical protein FH972_021382 [Carpinus fangiana]
MSSLIDPSFYHRDAATVPSLRKARSHAAILSTVGGLARRPAASLGRLAGGLYTRKTTEQQELENRTAVLYHNFRHATTYNDWREAAVDLDHLEGNNAWKHELETDEYDFELVRARLRDLDDARISCDPKRMLFLIRTALTRHLGGMGSVRLYKHSHIGTKVLIDNYIDSALETISALIEATRRPTAARGLDSRHLLEQILAARQAFGRSALLLSGGGTFGMNHIGVVKALWEARFLPRIISGASAGSIVASVLCSRTDDELPAVIDEFCYGDLDVFTKDASEASLSAQAIRFLKHGSLFDVSNLQRVMKNLLGDMTFQEAYNRTRRILNICVSSASVYELPRLLNYITAPNVIIWSAVQSSCSVPLVFASSPLRAKDPHTGEAYDWNPSTPTIDGSVDNDLPMTRLAELFNVNHFIVSQVNPHVVPFLDRDEDTMMPVGQHRQNVPRAGPGWLHTMADVARGEAMHRMQVLTELGVFPTLLTKTMSILSQRYSGDITILPEVPYSQFPNVLKNPTSDFMIEASQAGERATWPKLGRIQNHCAIELALDDAVQQLRARIAFSPSQVDLRAFAIQQPVSRATSVTDKTSTSGKRTRLRMVQSSKSFHNIDTNVLKPNGHSSGCDQLRLLSCTSRNHDAVKPYYVTSPIFYVNAAPHVGHLYSMVLTDILKRWQQFLGNEAFLTTGTDEHGMKVQQAATKAGSDPKSFCDKGADVFKSLASRAQVSYDNFSRTTDADHRDAVQYAWTVLQEKGHIYLSKHEGWYSVSDETFYPQSGVHLIVDPPTGRKMMASIETGKEVEWSSETNYRFRLSSFRDELLELYRSNPNFIVPDTRMKDVIQQVEGGLEDLSVSRPSSRLTWGIPVPTDETQTIYVWLDALINYATKAGYPFTPGKESARGWPADCHVIGKDIVRFHCIYWPAFLIALGVPVPKQILTHAHWTLGREKMAKSTGNVVNPFFALDRFGVDTMRFYLAHDGGISSDSDYSNEWIIARYKKLLQGGLGGLSSRIIRGKGWNVRRAVERATSADAGSHEMDESISAHVKLIRDLPAKVAGDMKSLDISGGLKEIMNVINKEEPWTLADSDNPSDKVKLDQIIYTCTEALRLSALLMQPVMPDKMHKLLELLGVEPERRTFEFAKWGGDDSYGVPRIDVGRGHTGAVVLNAALPSTVVLWIACSACARRGESRTAYRSEAGTRDNIRATKPDGRSTRCAHVRQIISRVGPSSTLALASREKSSQTRSIVNHSPKAHHTTHKTDTARAPTPNMAHQGLSYTAYPPHHHLTPAQPISAAAALTHIQSYLTRAQDAPHLHPDAIFTAHGPQLARHAPEGGLVLQLLRRVEKGLKGERIVAALPAEDPLLGGPGSSAAALLDDGDDAGFERGYGKARRDGLDATERAAVQSAGFVERSYNEQMADESEDGVTDGEVGPRGSFARDGTAAGGLRKRKAGPLSKEERKRAKKERRVAERQQVQEENERRNRDGGDVEMGEAGEGEGVGGGKVNGVGETETGTKKKREESKEERKARRRAEKEAKRRAAQEVNGGAASDEDEEPKAVERPEERGKVEVVDRLGREAQPTGDGEVKKDKKEKKRRKHKHSE